MSNLRLFVDVVKCDFLRVVGKLISFIYVIVFYMVVGEVYLVKEMCLMMFGFFLYLYLDGLKNFWIMCKDDMCISVCELVVRCLWLVVVCGGIGGG